MFKKKSIFMVFIVGALLLCIPSSVKAITEKLSGADRYATSAAIAMDGWKESDYAVLASGESFPDALTAAPLAKKYNAPILLTKAEYIPTDILNVIQKLKVKQIIIIGGTGVISPKVERQLDSLGIRVCRLGGADRYATSIQVGSLFNDISEIAVVSGEDFADALSISPIAAKNGMPVILVPHNEMPDVVKEDIDALKINKKINKTYIIGVGSSLDKSLVSSFPNVEQINGQDKYGNNLAVINRFKDILDLNTVYLTTGEDFADGISGCSLAGTNCNPLILVGKDSVLQKGFLDHNSITNYNIVVLGGAVTEKAVAKFGSSNIDYEVKKISDVANVNLKNVTKIVFSDARDNKPLTVEDKQKITEFMGYLDGYTVKKAKNPKVFSSWIHHANFYVNDKEVMDITFVDPMNINETYYNIIKGDLDTDKIDKFLKSIDSSYNTSGDAQVFFSKNNIVSFKIRNIPCEEKEIKSESDREKILDSINNMTAIRTINEELTGTGFGITVTYSDGKKLTASFSGYNMIYIDNNKVSWYKIDEDIIDMLRSYYDSN